jgi:DNA-directed RNA polymerase specialized sigma24 family protein
MMQVRTGQLEATRSENQSDSRRDVIEGLSGLEAASADLRASLLQLEERVLRARQHLEGGGPAADLPRVAHVMEQRAEVNACLADMQQARHRSQRSLFLLAVDEGFSLAEIARTWGISRQLVSRMTKEEPGQGSPA